MVASTTRDIIRARVQPDDDQWFVEAVAEQWWEDHKASGALHKDMAVAGTRWRASWSGQCARKIAYNVVGLEESNPMTAADHYRTRLGTLVHDEIQTALLRRFGDDVDIEIKVTIGEYGSGHADVSLRVPNPDTSEPPLRICIELKSIGPTGWRGAFAARGGGPRVSAVLQGAVNAYAMNADLMIVALFSLEPSQPEVRDANGMPPTEFGRFTSQWTYTKNEFTQLALDEIKRMEYIIDQVDEAGGDYTVIPRIIPDPWKPPHEIVEPGRSTYVEKTKDGLAAKKVKTWECNYCGFQSVCQDIKDAEVVAERKRKADEAFEEVHLLFPGTREAISEEADGIKRETPAKWDE